MKRILLSISFLISFMSLFSQSVDIEMTDGSIVTYKTQDIKTIRFHEGPSYVDLGLTSGNLWATENIGASSETDYGNYFAWGEVEPKTDFSESSYKYSQYDESSSQYKYTKYVCESSSNRGYNGFYDNKDSLDLEDDAAFVAYGGNWRTPNLDDLNELVNECQWTNEGNGYRVSKNGKSIFLPFAEYKGYGPGLGVNGYGYYMASQNTKTDAKEIKYLSICGYYYRTRYTNWRHLGISIRPVYKPNKNGK